jgi:hypothetical protein
VNPYQIIYDIECADGNRHKFRIDLDPRTLSIIRAESHRFPEWCRLEFEQCVCCPLDPERDSYCPVAVNISEIIEIFKDRVSSDECKIRCITPERIYLKKTSLMEGLSSVLGIIMATSDCPVMNFFKPMARFHLPFSTGEETTVRATSMFLLSYYLKHGSDGSPREAMAQLEANYARVKQVNEGLFARITGVSSEDADKNAIVMLHSLSQLLSMEIDYNLDSIAFLFDRDED